ncbi:class A beta-lactamase [Leptospira sp. severe_002]|nr:class A beta-lactamase [Leptospira sp. severe_002]
MTTRRDFIAGTGALAATGIFGAAHAAGLPDSLASELARIARESGGRLGVAVLDTGSGARAGLRADDRFPMCSTFKFLAAAAVLKRVDEGKEKLDRHFAYTKKDFVAYSPVTKERVAQGMTLADLCEAAVTLSDNTAANLILTALGGPQGVTQFARALGDPKTRLDRNEPSLNQAVPGDPRDTTTPNAMLGNLQKLVLGDALSPASKELLTKWLLGNKTGDARMRAHLPEGWRVGDKTGSGRLGTTNDVGVIWPPDRAPIVLAIYLTETTAHQNARNGTLAAVGAAVAGLPGSTRGGSGTY